MKQKVMFKKLASVNKNEGEKFSLLHPVWKSNPETDRDPEG